MTLAEYFRSVASKRWRVGTMDCAVFMADWVREVTGRDPIADVRGKYTTDKQMWRIVRGEGGFEASCAVRLAAVGLRETDAPKHGDILIVNAPYAIRRGKAQCHPVGAICVDGAMRAVMTADMGLVIAGEDRLPILRVWTF